MRSVDHPRAPGRTALRGVQLALLTVLLAMGLVPEPGPAPGDPGAGAPVRSEAVILGADAASGSRLQVPHLRLRSKVLGGPLVPGVRHRLRVAVVNQFDFPVRVHRVRAWARQPEAVSCSPTWVKVKPFTVTRQHPAFRVRAHTKKRIALRIRLVNLRDVNQDACKGVTFTLALRAKARRA